MRAPREVLTKICPSCGASFSKRLGERYKQFIRRKTCSSECRIIAISSSNNRNLPVECEHPERPYHAKGMCKECYGKRKNRRYLASLKLDSEKRTQISSNKNDARLRRLYGINESTYRDMLSEQNNLCAICAERDESNFGRKLAVDHDWDTNRVRGLLCARCNYLVGRSSEMIPILERAIAYLKRFSC